MLLPRRVASAQSRQREGNPARIERIIEMTERNPLTADPGRVATVKGVDVHTPDIHPITVVAGLAPRVRAPVVHCANISGRQGNARMVITVTSHITSPVVDVAHHVEGVPVMHAVAWAGIMLHQGRASLFTNGTKSDQMVRRINRALLMPRAHAGSVMIAE